MKVIAMGRELNLATVGLALLIQIVLVGCENAQNGMDVDSSNNIHFSNSSYINESQANEHGVSMDETAQVESEDSNQEDSIIDEIHEGESLEEALAAAESGNRYIISFTEDILELPLVERLPYIEDLAAELINLYGGEFVNLFTDIYPGIVVDLSEEQLENWMEDYRVVEIERDQIIELNEQQEVDSWGLDRIDQIDNALDGIYEFYQSGQDVHAYIIDSGIRATHDEFNGRVGGGVEFIGDGQGTGDCNGHGTHVAGIVGGEELGVAKEVILHPVRVFGCGNTTTVSTVIAGIDWVARNAVGPAVVNLSLGGSPNTSQDNAVRNLTNNHGITVVVSAGNDGMDACNQSPARVGEAITVGATDQDDLRADFSNWGSCLDIFAPGKSIRSAYKNSDTSIATMSGTSMAAPYVAGVAALYLSAKPEASPSEVMAAMQDESIREVVGSAGSGSPNMLLHSKLSETLPQLDPQVTYNCVGRLCWFEPTVESSEEDRVEGYEWTFTGSSTTSSTEENPRVFFNQAGEHEVTLKVLTRGRSESVTQTISIREETCESCIIYSGYISRGSTVYLPGAAGFSPRNSAMNSWLYTMEDSGITLSLESQTSILGITIPVWLADNANIVENTESGTGSEFAASHQADANSLYRWKITTLEDGYYRFIQSR